MLIWQAFVSDRPGILTNKAATKWLRPYSYSKTGVCLLLSYRQVNVLCSASLESVVKKSFLFTRTATIDFGSFSVSIWQISRTDNTLNNAELKYLVYWHGGVEGCYFMLIQGISTRKYAYRSHFPQHLPGGQLNKTFKSVTYKCSYSFRTLKK